jgi:hypothetical protein
LKALGAPVPQPDPQAVAWMTAELNAPRQHETLITRPLALVRTGPKQEMDKAAKVGKPTMTPESESETGIDVLTGGGQPRIGGAGTGIVATVTPGGTSVTTGGTESVAPAAEGTETTPATQPDPNAPATTDNSGSGTTAAGTAAAPAASGPAADATKTDGTTAQGGTQNGSDGNSTKESTSKKKKGLKKIVPW